MSKEVGLTQEALDMLSNHLADELIIHVLQFCDYATILRFAATSKRNYQIVSNSVLLQLAVELDTNSLDMPEEGVPWWTNNPNTLRNLREYRDAWYHLDSYHHFTYDRNEQEPIGWDINGEQFVKLFSTGGDPNYPDSLETVCLEETYSNIREPCPVNFDIKFRECAVDVEQGIAILLSVDDESPDIAQVHFRCAHLGSVEETARSPVITIESGFPLTWRGSGGTILKIMGDFLVVKLSDPRCFSYEVLVFDWISGIPRHRIASSTGICSFALLDKEHLVIYSTNTGQGNGSEPQFPVLSIYAISPTPHNESVRPSTVFHVSSLPIVEPILIFGFPNLDPLYSVSHQDFCISSRPAPGSRIPAGHPGFMLSHTITFQVNLSLSRVSSVHRVQPDLSFRIFISGSLLLQHLKSRDRSTPEMIAWDDWGENATRWFVEIPESLRERPRHCMYGSRYVRADPAGWSPIQYLSVLDFHPSSTRRACDMARVGANQEIFTTILELKAPVYHVLAGTLLIEGFIAKNELNFRRLQDEARRTGVTCVLVEVVGRELPTVITKGFESPFPSRLPFRVSTRVEELPSHDHWVIEGTYIVGVNSQLGTSKNISVYSLLGCAESYN